MTIQVLPCQQPNPMRSIPEDIWRQIFWAASATPAVDEFSHNPAFHFNNLPIGDMGTSHMSKDQLRIARQCRRRLVLVCRSWASFGTSILWSHLHLSLLHASRILDTLQRKPKLGQFVQRITSPEAEGTLPPFEFRNDGSVQSILELCPNVHAVSLPVFDSPLEVPQHARHIHLHFEPTPTCKIFPILPHKITSLRISLFIQEMTFTKLEFPALQALDILQLGVSWIDVIIDNWSLPSLKFLAISDIGDEGMRFLRRYAATVSIIYTSATFFYLGHNDTNGIHFDLPKLRHIYMHPNPDTIPLLSKRLAVPHLQIISIYWPFSRQSPKTNIEKKLVKDRFLTFLHRLFDVTTTTVTIRILGRDEFCDWLITRKEVWGSLDAFRRTGRIVQRETPDGDLVAIPSSPIE